MLDLYPYDIIASALLVTGLLYARESQKNTIKGIPIVGSSMPLVSFLNSLRTKFDVIKNVREGYAKYGDGLFIVPVFTGRTTVVVANTKFIEEMRKAPDDVLSFFELTKDTLPIIILAGSGWDEMGRRFHLPIIKNQFTKNLDKLFLTAHEEILFRFERHAPAGEDWTSRHALTMTRDIICGAINRTLVGRPTCRNEEYLKLISEFTTKVITGAEVTNIAPNFLKSIVQKRFIDKTLLNRCIEILDPIVKNREQQYEKYGVDYPDKPLDFLSFLMDEAQGEERSTRSLTLRLFGLNFASMHTTTMTITRALYHVAGRPELVKPLRDEIESVISTEGWTKSAVDKMYKMDSLFRDTLYLTGLTCFGITRKCMQDFTFSDGTTVPAGTYLTSLRKDMLYPVERPPFTDILGDPAPGKGDNQSEDSSDSEIDVEKQKEKEGASGGAKSTPMVATSATQTHFGHGRHACPGRFFAAMEMKLFMAHLLMNYDVKPEGDIAPESSWMGRGYVPDGDAKIMFRRREM